MKALLVFLCLLAVPLLPAQDKPNVFCEDETLRCFGK